MKIWIVTVTKNKRTQIANIKNEKGDIITYLMYIKISQKKKNYEKLYTYKFDNLDDMDQLPERYNLPKMTQEEVEMGPYLLQTLNC